MAWKWLLDYVGTLLKLVLLTAQPAALTRPPRRSVLRGRGTLQQDPQSAPDRQCRPRSRVTRVTLSLLVEKFQRHRLPSGFARALLGSRLPSGSLISSALLQPSTFASTKVVSFERLLAQRTLLPRMLPALMRAPSVPATARSPEQIKVAIVHSCARAPTEVKSGSLGSTAKVTSFLS